jgi:diamine N-acetyltransferase
MGPRQGQGLGRRAMTALIATLRERPDCGPIALTVRGENTAARGLYASLGFAETGEVVDGERVMMLAASTRLPPQDASR